MKNSKKLSLTEFIGEDFWVRAPDATAAARDRALLKYGDESKM